MLGQVKAGGDFAALAQEHSDDTSTAANAGDYGMAITRSTADIDPRVIEVLFSLQKDQTSELIMTPQGIEIVKVLENDGTTVRAAHILFEYQDIGEFVKPIQDERGLRRFIGL